MLSYYWTFPRAQHTMSSNGIILEVKASSSVTLTPVTQLIKDLYLPAEISLRSESLQVLIGVCAHMCLYLLSTTISTDSGYTLETAINFQSSLDTSLLLQTSRDLSVSDSHTLSANTSSCESRHLELLLSTADEARVPFCWQRHPGWCGGVWYAQCFPLLSPGILACRHAVHNFYRKCSFWFLFLPVIPYPRYFYPDIPQDFHREREAGWGDDIR